MKNLLYIFILICFYCPTQNVMAQQDPISDRNYDALSNVDTIPSYRSKQNKLKLTGIVYKSDGKTPAEDVVIYIEQPNQNGDFELRGRGNDRYVFHRSWVKTNADGRYTFFTFVPGGDRKFNQMQQIFPIVKAPSNSAIQLPSLLFNEDPLLTKRCRKQLNKKGETARILKTELTNGILVANKDIVLPSNTEPLE